jgi:DNA-binding LacI/PurR family transcriptional regulator
MLASAPSKRRKKQNTKTGQIVVDIRQQIVTGRYQPGDKLPTYDVFSKEYQASKMTIQMAFNQLKADGFVESVVRQGLFVANRPPHVNRFALLLPVHEEHNRYWRILIDEAVRYTRRIGYELEVVNGIDEADKRAGLREEIAKRRFAGLILACKPLTYDLSDIMNDATIPKATFSSLTSPSTINIKVDTKELAEKSLDYFAASSRKRVAYITCYGLSSSYGTFLQGVKARGMETCEAWQFALENPEMADNVVQLLMSLPKERRPDALLLDDDNIEESAHRGLIKSGVKIPEELDVLCYCNWGHSHRKLFPLKYIGFDIAAGIAQSIDFFTTFSDNPVPAKACVLPALFEHELGKKQGE